MFCGNCGKELKQGLKFCPYCGWAVVAAQEPVKEPEKPAELRCSACGTLIEEGGGFCANCGKPVKGQTAPAYAPQAASVQYTANRVRHGFTSFWLILGVVTSSIAGLVYLILSCLPDAVAAMGMYMSPMVLMATGAAMIAEVVCLVLLLKWKKIGFWMLLGVVGIVLIINLAEGGNVAQIMFAILGTGAFWGVLQIPKNGKTTWEQLE